jgi:hypothetical protein
MTMFEDLQKSRNTMTIKVRHAALPSASVSEKGYIGPIGSER